MLLVEDSPRNLLKWIEGAVEKRHHLPGAVISPFASPVAKVKNHRSVREISDAMLEIGGQVWFDPQTHALQMSNVGDFRFYDGYDLWAGGRGDLSSSDLRQGHIDKVFAIQSSLHATRLAPTILLHHGESQDSERALALAEAACETSPDCWLTIAGTGPFWASREALDAHIGLSPNWSQPVGSWFLSGR